MKINLSERMQIIADMVIAGEAVADIGTDHGYIPAYLLSNEICPRVLLCDIAEGPLSRAENTLIKFEAQGGELRLGSGLEIVENSEVSSIIIAGMGGELIEEILGKDPVKSKSFKKFILQPRTKASELRIWLSENGFSVNEYRLARENGRICEVFSAVPEKGSPENPIISESLVKSKDPLLKDFIDYEIKKRETTLDNLKNSKTIQTKKLEDINKEIEYLKGVIRDYAYK